MKYKATYQSKSVHFTWVVNFQATHWIVYFITTSKIYKKYLMSSSIRQSYGPPQGSATLFVKQILETRTIRDSF